MLKDIGKTDEETLQWILNKANWIDPTISMEDDLLGKRDHHKSKEEKVTNDPSPLISSP